MLGPGAGVPPRVISRCRLQVFEPERVHVSLFLSFRSDSFAGVPVA